MPQAVSQTESRPKGPQGVILFPADLNQSVPWRHHSELIAKVKDLATRQWYMQATLANGWSDNILVMQIEVVTHTRQGSATTNFAKHLPLPNFDLVQQTLKAPTCATF